MLVGWTPLLRLVPEVTGGACCKPDPICKEDFSWQVGRPRGAENTNLSLQLLQVLICLTNPVPHLSFSQLAISPSSSLWDNQSPGVQWETLGDMGQGKGRSGMSQDDDSDVDGCGHTSVNHLQVLLSLGSLTSI